MKKTWAFDLGAIIADLKKLSHEHSLDGELSKKVDDLADRLLLEVKTTRKEVIWNWRVMQVLMALALLAQFVI